MNNFFQTIFTKITTFFTVTVITVSSIFPWSDKKIEEPIITPIEITSTIVGDIGSSELSSLSTLVSNTKLTPTIKVQVKNENIETIESIPTVVTPQPTVSKTKINNAPVASNNNQPETYSIIPISMMNISSMEPHLQIIAQRAYQEFLRTSNINQLDDATQIEILVGIYARMLREEIANTQQNISQIQQTPTPVPIYVNSEVEAKLAELRQTLENIQDQPVAMDVINGRMQRAYQDWMSNNPSIYSAILSSRYTNDLNIILREYGL